MKTKMSLTVPPVPAKTRDIGIVIPGYKINEYLLVLSPHEDLRNKIMQGKVTLLRHLQKHQCTA